jgi:hypothetical protein
MIDSARRGGISMKLDHKKTNSKQLSREHSYGYIARGGNYVSANN